MSDSGYEPTQHDMAPVTPGAGTPSVPPPVGPGGGLPPEPPEPPDRRPWIIGGLIGAIVLVIVLLLLLGGDDGDDDVASEDTTTSTEASTTTSTSSTTTSTTSTSTTTTTIATTTTAAPTTTTTAAPLPCEAEGSDPNDPALAAQTVYDAWLADDAECADTLMGEAAQESLFNRTPQPRDFQGCTAQQAPSPHQDCAFFTPDEGTSALHLLLEFEGGLWEVFAVEESEG